MSLSKERLSELCREEGFTRVRCTKAKSNVALGHYDRFLSFGHHGTMDWMVRSRPPRANLYELLPAAQTVVVLGVDYWHPRPQRPAGLVGKVSCYAWGRDYHKVIQNQLKRLSRRLREVDATIEGYFTVDSRPVIERGWAHEAGLGFLGKNTMIISPADSSYFFLATLILNVELEADAPIAKDHCGRCTRCLTACPTDAFKSAFQLDARRCISYLTIEHEGVISAELANRMGDWIFGCDVCQDVCPHNHRKHLSEHPDLAPRPQHAWLDIEWLFRESDDRILQELNGTPLRRTGLSKLRRNALIVLQNTETAEADQLITWIERSHLDEVVQRQLLELKMGGA